jgi:hypothetical protein
MLQEGKINAEQAEKLLDALGATRQEAAPGAGPGDFGKNLGSQIRDSISRAMAAGGLPGVGGGTRLSFANMAIDQASLKGMPDGSSLVIFGLLTIADDVSEELLTQKIGKLVNFGNIIGPERLRGAMQSLTPVSFGNFVAREPKPADRSTGRRAEDDEKAEKSGEGD